MFYFDYVFIPQQTDIHNDKWMDNELAMITHIRIYMFNNSSTSSSTFFKV